MTGYRKAQIELKPNSQGTGFIINVWITEGSISGGLMHHLVKDYAYVGTTFPANLSYGFAGSTGGSTNFHEVRNLDIRVPETFDIPSLMTTKEGNLGGTVNRFSNIQSNKDASIELSATNLISPNGDGRNDTWVIRNIEKYPGNAVRVFDRLGRLVYSATNYNNGWDGIYQGALLPEDTYYYIIELSDKVEKKRGYISIVR
jgi:gliding motility-associated-like protein